MRGSFIVKVRFPRPELDRLAMLAKRMGVTRSGVVRLAVDKLFEKVYHTESHDLPPAEAVEVTATSSVEPPASAPSSDDIDDLLAELEIE